MVTRVHILNLGCACVCAGRSMAALGEHPRLAHMLLTSERLGWCQLGCLLAALISDGDIMRSDATTGADIRLRMRAVLDGLYRAGLFLTCKQFHHGQNLHRLTWKV